MKTKAKKNNSKGPFSQEKRRWYHYRNYDTSNVTSMRDARDLYRHQDYRKYSHYKYISPPVKRPGSSYKKKHTSRPGSPVLGSEEYMKKKIEQRSAIIMKQLLNPNEQPTEIVKDIKKNESQNDLKSQKNDKLNEVPLNNSGKSKNKKSSHYNIVEIHNKIMNHITKLNDGKKKNLINSNMSGYDTVIGQIQKQRRLEISRALRTMCSQSNKTQESADFINSIIPDIGIKIEDLPQDVIEELRNTLNLGMDDWNCDDLYNGDIDSNQLLIGNRENTQILDDVSKDSAFESQAMDLYVKQELLEDSNAGTGNESNMITSCQTGHNAFENYTDSTNRATESCIIPDNICVKLEPVDFSTTLFTKTNETNCCESIENILASLNNINSGTVKPTYIKEKPSSVRANYCQEAIINTDCCLSNSNISYTENTPESKHEITDCNSGQPIHLPDKSNSPDISIKLESIDNFFCQSAEANVSDENITQTTNGRTCEQVELRCSDSVHEHVNISTLDIKKEVDDSIYEHYNLQNDSNFTQTECGIVEIKEEDRYVVDINFPQNIHENGDIVNKRITELTLTSTVSTQTNEDRQQYSTDDLVENFISKYNKEAPKNMREVISRMFEIDQCILKLTNYRQSLFHNFNSIETRSVATSCDENCKEIHSVLRNSSSLEGATLLPKKRKKKFSKKARKLKKLVNVEGGISSCSKQKGGSKKKNPLEEINSSKKCKETTGETATSLKNTNDVGLCEKSLVLKRHLEDNTIKRLQFVDCNEKVLVIKVTENQLVAGTESGKIIFYSLENGLNTRTVNCCQLPITSLLFLKDIHNKSLLYVGSLGIALKMYNLTNYCIMENLALEDSIQCMEHNWGYIFIGGVRGYLLRYSLKKKVVEYEDKFSDTSILVLKATLEGARRVLLVGSRNTPVCIRDAMTGLYMRTMENVISPTVYSLIMEKNLIYCGTTNHDILVYSFHDGKLIHRYKATSSKGIGCMKIDRNLLFASCHNGNIYVYDIEKNVFLSAIEGPGGVILSMEIFENQVIVGTISFKFVSIPVPQHILRHRIK